MENSVYQGRVCAECKQYKEAENFSVRNTGKLYSYCRPCNAMRTKIATAKNPSLRKVYNKAWYQENKASELERLRKARYLRVYGIPYEEIIAKLNRQNFLCEICEKEITEKTMAVDHCHGSKKVRGLLCNLCNISLAPLERPGFLDKAVSYIERHRSRG